jgi:ABC-type glycerol-3-phosphate transport system substrate-binding protein
MKYGMRGLAAMVLVALGVGLAGCAGGVPADVAGSQASGASGVTVFGTIDTNVSHTRTSR